MQPGVEYTFKLKAECVKEGCPLGLKPGSSSTKVVISTPPRGGTLEITDRETRRPTTTGQAVTTEFGLSAPGWIGDTSLMYDYFAINEMGVEEPLGGGSKTFTMRIGTPGLWTIQVRVTDAFGAEGVATAGPLTIEETVLDSGAAEGLLDSADTLAKGGSSSF